MRYEVRTKKYEKKNWKVVARFDDRKEALRFAIQSEMKARRNFETMFDGWDLKDTETKERFIVA